MSFETLEFDTREPDGEGWSPLVIDSAYAQALGALFVAHDPPRLWLEPTAGLANIAGVVHGGALATLADIALFVAAGQGRLERRAVTVTLQCSYLSAATLDAPLLAIGEVTRAGRSLVFAEGRITQGGRPVLSFSGTLKRLTG